jgi:hypothetical protein
MMSGLRAVLRGLNDVRHQGYIYIWANLAFVLCSLPIVTMPAAYAALCRVSHQAQESKRGADLDLFFETFRAMLLRSLPWAGLLAIGIFINVTNLMAYGPATGVGPAMLRVVWIGALGVWVGLILYTWPIYYEMVNPSVLGAMRNALVMMARNPFFTAGVVVGTLIVMGISTLSLVAWLLLTCGAMGAIGTAAVRDRLALYRGIPLRTWTDGLDS